jgi:hypothetical protein
MRRSERGNGNVYDFDVFVTCNHLDVLFHTMYSRSFLNPYQNENAEVRLITFD